MPPNAKQRSSHLKLAKCATTIALHVSSGTHKRAPDTCGLLSPSHEPNNVTCRCHQKGTQHEVRVAHLRTPTRREAQQPKECLPRRHLQDNSTPGTMKRTSFEFPGAANCGPDFDAESTTVTRTGADTSLTRPSNTSRIET